jgi:hypothetical protein
MYGERRVSSVLKSLFASPALSFLFRSAQVPASRKKKIAVPGTRKAFSRVRYPGEGKNFELEKGGARRS